MSLELRIRDGLPAETEAHLAIEPVRSGYGIVDQCGQKRLVSRCAPVRHDKQRDLVVGVQERELPTRPKTEVAPVQGSVVCAGQFSRMLRTVGASFSILSAGRRSSCGGSAVRPVRADAFREAAAWAERSADQLFPLVMGTGRNPEGVITAGC
ncbi:hypothetical protein GCM10010421_62680 [Streptomyces glaucus]|uniref:Uncharacterized protein n=1 Tax=Streptomyces glaucus TaxID=284029 RepID=A0ABN3KLK8_9ACTN